MKKTQYGFGILEFMIAISLSALITLTLFHIFISMKNSYERQMLFSTFQERAQFISIFLGEKIKMTGNFSCASKKPESSMMIQRYTSDNANEKLGVTIKSGTDLLRLRECVRLHNKMQFLPIDFFVADTNRVTAKKAIIDALFMKINDHPREELIPGVVSFKVFVDKNSKLVSIHYVLSAVDNRIFYQSGVLNSALRIQHD